MPREAAAIVCLFEAPFVFMLFYWGRWCSCRSYSNLIESFKKFLSSDLHLFSYNWKQGEGRSNVAKIPMKSLREI